jgi:hypothetical protein
MRYKLVDIDKFSAGISNLLVESEDSVNPNPEHNAYNWGLAHANLLLSGATVESIKESR